MAFSACSLGPGVTGWASGAAQAWGARRSRSARSGGRGWGSGLQVDLERRGDLEGQPTTVGLCISRVVQESLTNVRTHAPTATARVRVDGRTDTVVVEAADDGPGDRGPGDGHGLIGM